MRCLHTTTSEQLPLAANKRKARVASNEDPAQSEANKTNSFSKKLPNSYLYHIYFKM